MVSGRMRASLAALWASLACSTSAWALDASCQVKYPIVLSHLWGAAPICADPTVTGVRSCENARDYERYCVSKSQNPDGSKKCLAWRTPDDEADLPPRDYNVNDPTLVRDLRHYGRYFSKAIVSRLTDTCGNKVYIADKPPLASYEVRARVLRLTVLQALRETGAEKVNVIGMSQGVQDARYMISVLPLDGSQPNGPKVGSKVAALVSLVGEDGGAESATLGLIDIHNKNKGDWFKIAIESGPNANIFLDTTWKRKGEPMNRTGMLVEFCQNAFECDLSQPLDQYRWTLRSLVNLSPMYMRPNKQEYLARPIRDWDALLSFVGEPHKQWTDVVPPGAEANNGVHYMSYEAQLRFAQPSWGGSALVTMMGLLAGPNDSNVSIKRQRFANKAPNFEDVKLMRGAPGSTGYHHTFFSGANDAMYASSKPSEQEPAPYGGSSADFMQQVARDLKVRGF